MVIFVDESADQAQAVNDRKRKVSTIKSEPVEDEGRDEMMKTRALLRPVLAASTEVNFYKPTSPNPLLITETEHRDDTDHIMI